MILLIILIHVIDFHDVRVVELHMYVGLPERAGLASRVLYIFLRDRLYCFYFLIKSPVNGRVHNAKAALSENVLKLVYLFNI